MYVMYIREYIYYLVSLVFSSLFREDVHVGRMVEGVGSREARACDLTVVSQQNAGIRSKKVVFETFLRLGLQPVHLS